MTVVMTSQDALERLLALRPVAERRVCPDCPTEAPHIGHGWGTIPDPATKPLTGVLFGKAAVEGEVCPATNYLDLDLGRHEVDCPGGCGGTRRIGASPAIEGCLVACPCLTSRKLCVACKRYPPRHGKWCACHGTDKALHPHLAWALDNGEDEMACGFMERRLKPFCRNREILPAKHLPENGELWVGFQLESSLRVVTGHGPTRFDALLNAIEQAWGEVK